MIREIIKLVGIISAIAILFGVVNYTEHHYKREAIVLDGYTVEDNAGYIWLVSTYGYAEGDEVTLYMYDNCTTSIYDDVVERIK